MSVAGPSRVPELTGGSRRPGAGSGRRAGGLARLGRSMLLIRQLLHVILYSDGGLELVHYTTAQGKVSFA